MIAILALLPWSLHKTSWHKSIGTPPFKLEYGRNVRSPAEAIALSSPSAASVDQDYVNPDRVLASEYASAQFRFKMRQAQLCLHYAQSRQILFADGKRRDASLSVGEEVLLSTSVRLILLPMRVSLCLNLLARSK